MSRASTFRPFVNAPTMSETISASDMQRLNPSIYPSDIPSLTGDFTLPSDTNMWSSDPMANPTVNPSYISGGSIQPSFNNLTFPNLAHKQVDDRRRSSAETQIVSNARVRYGQITPPSDHSPSNPSLSFSEETKPVVRSSIEEPVEVPTKRRRSSARTRGGSRSGSSHASNSVEPSPPGDDKQEKTRARNRLAASKCRQKKKEQNNQLESKYEYEKIRNEELTRTVNSLRDAIVEAKDQLLAHSECGHDSIKAYIQGMAKKITVVPERIEGHAFPAQYYGCGPMDPKRESIGFDFDACPPTA
ncbi:hypothetical protein BDV19DRAFT_361736 [Aspergillus venezuelensis]